MPGYDAPLGIEAIHAGIRSQPKHAILVLRDRPHLVVTQTLGIVGLVFVNLKSFMLRVKPAQAFAIGAHPDAAMLVLVQRQDRRAARYL